jgi:methionyl-tRNA synthetase
MDEHGQKVARAAEARGIPPQQLVDELAANFQAMWERLAISHDLFWRTTDPRHTTGVHALIERLAARNPADLYEHEYEGNYCVGCEQFKREGDLVDGQCPLHPTRAIEWIRERNWFFRLTRYGDFLRGVIQRPGFLEPASRRNEMLALLDQGLEDISVTRARLSWAIPFPRPLSTGETQGTWVWFDALPNYLTATGFPGAGYDTRWPAQLHVIGKDIVRLHTIIWPAMLEAAGLPLPERVWGHGWLSFGGERFSKSAGVKVELRDAIDHHGADALRYFLLREVPWDADGSFTWERFDERYTADLADGLGNLVSRVLAMLERYRGGVVPQAAEPTELDRRAGEILTAYAREMEALLLHRAAQAAWELVSESNVYVDRRAPWTQAKTGDAAGLDVTLAALARALVRLAVLVHPFLPAASDAIWRALKGGAAFVPNGAWAEAENPRVEGSHTFRIPPLFPKPPAGREVIV